MRTDNAHVEEGVVRMESILNSFGCGAVSWWVSAHFENNSGTIKTGHAFRIKSKEIPVCQLWSRDPEGGMIRGEGIHQSETPLRPPRVLQKIRDPGHRRITIERVTKRSKKNGRETVQKRLLESGRKVASTSHHIFRFIIVVV